MELYDLGACVGGNWSVDLSHKPGTAFSLGGFLTAATSAYVCEAMEGSRAG